MKYLQELGINTSDASMRWVGNDVVPNIPAFDSGYDGIFTYTIGDLIEKLPKDIRNYDLEIHCDFNCLGYAAASGFEYSIEYDKLIDGLYDLLCWVAENHKELLEVKK